MKMFSSYGDAAEKINSMIDKSAFEQELEELPSDEDATKDEVILEETFDDSEVVVVPHNDLQIFEDHDFDKEFSKLTADSLDHRKIEKKIIPFDSPVPSKLKRSTIESNASEVSFTLLTKRGHKQHVCFFINYKV